MEENKKSRRSINQSFNSKSVLGSLFLAVVAVVAVVVLGFNSSYAIPDVTYNLPDSFKTKEPGDEIYSDGQPYFSVFPYFTDGGIQVFCLERGVDYQYGDDYVFNKGASISGTDNGLLYVMASVNSNAFKSLNENLRTWVSQVAIWVYLYETQDLADDGIDNDSVQQFDGEVKNVHYLSAEELATIRSAKGVTLDGMTYYTAEGEVQGLTTGVTKTLYDTYIKDIVNAALANRTTANKTITIDFDDEVGVTQDNKYYQTSEVSVVGNPSDNFNGFELKIVSAPTGTFVVDVNGNEIKDLTNLKSTDKFYFRVPIDSVTEDNKTVKFTVTGSFSTYEGNYYTAVSSVDGTVAQTISSVDTVYNNINDGAEIPLNYTPKVPDTGMSTAQTVYFVGLIILLSGVGIIYANVKPEESK